MANKLIAPTITWPFEKRCFRAARCDLCGWYGGDELGEVRKAVLVKLQCGSGPEPTDDPFSSCFLVTGY
jgi:hypothetical protein